MEGMIVVSVFVLLVIITISLGVRIVPQGSKHVVQRLGKYHKTLGPGLNIIFPYIDRVAQKVTTKDIVLDIPSQEEVDGFLPRFQPRQVLDPAAPLSMGAMVGPEAFTEVRYLAHHKQREALQLIPQHAAEFERHIGRNSGGLLKEFDCAGKETVVVTMGSVIGTMKSVLGEMREEGASVGALSIRSYRPFPSQALRDALANAERVIVFEKSLAVGMGGMLAADVRMALSWVCGTQGV